jgi:hypothetical protein
VLGFGLLACGSTSGPVLERVQPIEPPEFTHRVDVFLTAGVSSCAVGRACASTDPSDCFYVGSAANRTMFEPASVEFVRAGDARLAGAERSACFELDLDEPTRDLVARSFGDLRDEIYRASRGAIDLDLRFHLVTPPLGVFKLFEGGSGLFLQPDTLAAVGLPLMSPDSDFVFGVTGETNAESGALPKISPCAGTNWQAQGGLGGAAYTWLSASCAELSELRFHFMYQAYFAMRDVVGLVDPYGGVYPGCGRGAAAPELWFPRPTDCNVDPDAPACGEPSCDEATFTAHVLTSHWPSAPGLAGNHCRNGRMDFGETAPDTGGICDALGR